MILAVRFQTCGEATSDSFAAENSYCILSHDLKVSTFSILYLSSEQLSLTSQYLVMPRNLFSRSSSKQAPLPSSPELVSSSSTPQEASLSPPLEEASFSNAEENFLKSPLPRWSSPSMKSTSEISLREKSSAWNLIHKVKSSNPPSTKESIGAGHGSLERPSSPSTTTGHETELQSSPPSSPTANPRTSRSRGPKSKSKSKLASYRRERKPSEPASKIEAIEGELIASRHKIGTASVDCELYKIEYGQFKERPACLIVIDTRLVYSPENTIDSVKLEFQFSKDGEQDISREDHNVAHNTEAPISKVFAPEDIEGMPSYSEKTTHHNIKPKIEGLSFKIDTAGGGGQTTATKEHRWRVQGRREEHNGVYDIFGWNIYQNGISEDSVPRKVRLGMIAFHQHQPFCVNVSIEGSARQKRWSPKATCEKKWFYPPASDDVGRHVLQEVMVENIVSKQNILIRDIAQSRVMEGKTYNLIDFTEISGGAGTAIDGGEVLTDLLSVENIGVTADSPTAMVDSNSCT